MSSAFVTAAKSLLALYPQCDGCTFEPTQPFGPVVGDFGRFLLNLGVAGGLFLCGIAETITDKDIAKVFEHSADRDEFERWWIGLSHTFHGTQPETYELRALKALDEKTNTDLYRLMGLPVPNH